MLLTLDVGNSNLVAVGFDKDGNHLFENRLVTYKEDGYDRFVEWFQSLCKPELVEDVIIASVVPSIQHQIIDAVIKIFKKEPILLTVDLVEDFVIHLKNKREIGADFIATAYGAKAKGVAPVIIADFGSATKVSVLNQDFQFMGGVIMPGLEVINDALVRFIPHLPKVELQFPNQVIGTDTVSAIQSGLLYGTIGSIEGIVKRVEEEMNTPMKKIVTGGLSNVLALQMPDYIFDPFLLNDGLYAIYQERGKKNESKRTNI